ncbi:MAG: pantoate--beta-alanine ligase [Pseudomonadota bacterium]|nr:pantoate--beta-alanine ligase [Pseudomonadota bacterium]
MLTVKTKSDLRQALLEARLAGHTIGLVPTMGNLHDGHLQLIRAAAADCQYTVASIFVNPLQFEKNEDLSNYPRSLESDTGSLAEAGCDLLFAPDKAEMYGAPASMKTHIAVSGLTQNNCGKTRPGHFKGVATVVTKLFNLISPDQAYFGLKDYQQYRVIEQLIADLDFAIKLNGLPTAREDSGLALSSRNSRLTPEQRRLAPALYQQLQQTAELIRRGNQDLRRLEREASQSLVACGLKTDYFNICHAMSLEMACQHDKDLVILAAVFAGDVRLIDNVSLTI